MQDKYPVGECTQMCPEEEIIQRKREGRLHFLEILPNRGNGAKENRYGAVKEYVRSAAGRNSQNVANLRTIGALLETINYLLHDIMSMDHVKWHVKYDYITDRLRAVRQDMVIQNLPRSNCISILQPAIKFYAYSAYRLCEESVFKFDPVINRNHLLECLKRVLSCYDERDILMEKLVEIRGKNQFRKDELYGECRHFMESLYLVLNLGDTVAMNRAVRLPAIWRRHSLVKYSFRISLEFWRGNYVHVCRHILNLPPLLAATAALHLPFIRKRALRAMSCAYSSRNLTFPSVVLQKMLLYNTVEDLFNDCEYYEIPIRNGDIAFSNISMQFDKTEVLPTHCLFVDELLSKRSVTELLLENDDI